MFWLLQVTAAHTRHKNESDASSVYNGDIGIGSGYLGPMCYSLWRPPGMQHTARFARLSALDGKRRRHLSGNFAAENEVVDKVVNSYACG